MSKLIWALAIILAYFLGNISPASLLGKLAGVDIRKEGSGNPGTTNVLRVMGKKAAVLTLLIDVLKGVVAVLIGKYLGGEALALYCALVVFLGHLFPLLYGFKGGKGIATALGLLITLNLYLALACFAIALIGFVVFKRVSVGSLMAAVALPILAFKFMPAGVLELSAMAILVIFKHKENIKRLIKGQEPKIDLKSKKGKGKENE